MEYICHIMTTRSPWCKRLVSCSECSFNSCELNVQMFRFFPVLMNIYIIQNYIIGTRHKFKWHMLSETQVYMSWQTFRYLHYKSFLSFPSWSLLKSVFWSPKRLTFHEKSSSITNMYKLNHYIYIYIYLCISISVDKDIYACMYVYNFVWKQGVRRHWRL